MTLAALGALVTALVLTGICVPLLRRARLWDVPNHRSSHVDVTPRGGGLAVVVAFASWWAVLLGWTSDVALLLAAVAVMTVLGLLDDVSPRPARGRLVIQVLTGAGVTTAVLWGRVETPLLAVVLGVIGVLWFAGFVNAFNFMDGINGISALTTIVAGVWFWLAPGGSEVVQAGGLLIAASALGFLPWNAPRARIFLGDSGSYGIGAALATLALMAVRDGMAPLVALAPLLLYVADTAWVFVRRAWARVDVTLAHREHVYQRLVDTGRPHVVVASVVALVSCGLALAATLPEPWSIVGVAAGIVVYLSSPRWWRAAPVLAGGR